MNGVPVSELDQLPYIDAVPHDGRVPLLQVPYFDSLHGEWHLYFVDPDGHVGRMAGGESVYGAYFARSCADQSRDFELGLSTLITQHLSFPRLLDRLQRFENDVQNSAAVLEKYHLISAATTVPSYAAVLITTELEYLLALVRAMFDLLNEVVREIAPLLVTLTEEQRRIVRNQLPLSFADVAMHGDRLVPGDEIVQRRALPPAIANWYVREAAAFQVLRRIRDDVIHRGAQLPLVFDLGGYGLAVAKDEAPWNEFAFWEAIPPVNGKLVPLRLAFAQIVAYVIGASQRLVDSVVSCVQLPAPIGAGVRVYLRSPVTARLVGLPEMLRRPWERVPVEPNDTERA